MSDFPQQTPSEDPGYETADALYAASARGDVRPTLARYRLGSGRQVVYALAPVTVSNVMRPHRVFVSDLESRVQLATVDVQVRPSGQVDADMRYEDELRDDAREASRAAVDLFVKTLDVSDAEEDVPGGDDGAA